MPDLITPELFPSAKTFAQKLAPGTPAHPESDAWVADLVVMRDASDAAGVDGGFSFSRGTANTTDGGSNAFGCTVARYRVKNGQHQEVLINPTTGRYQLGSTFNPVPFRSIEFPTNIEYVANPTGTPWQRFAHSLQEGVAWPASLGYKPVGGTDHHLATFNVDTGKLVEVWHGAEDKTYGAPAGFISGWSCQMAGIMDSMFASATGFYEDSTNPYESKVLGSTSTSGSILAGLWTDWEIRNRIIPHALGLVYPRPSEGWVPPAHRSDGYPLGIVPMGARLRIKEFYNGVRVNVAKEFVVYGGSGVSAALAQELCTAVALCLQEYGAIVNDRNGYGSPISIRGEFKNGGANMATIATYMNIVLKCILEKPYLLEWVATSAKPQPVNTQPIILSQRGAANGVAPLDRNKKVPAIHLPDTANLITVDDAELLVEEEANARVAADLLKLSASSRRSGPNLITSCDDPYMMGNGDNLSFTSLQPRGFHSFVPVDTTLGKLSVAVKTHQNGNWRGFILGLDPANTSGWLLLWKGALVATTTGSTVGWLNLGTAGLAALQGKRICSFAVFEGGVSPTTWRGPAQASTLELEADDYPSAGGAKSPTAISYNTGAFLASGIDPGTVGTTVVPTATIAGSFNIPAMKLKYS